MFTILHISDLHRSPDEPVDNNSLLAAMVADRERYTRETPVVPSPDAIIVSGDLIQGAAFGCVHWQANLDAQYRVAGEFLDSLAKRFLAGDRSRLIMVPGNHDVCWNTSRSAMTRVPPAEYPPDVKDALNAPDSEYRWSWHDLALYKVNDHESYAKRMTAYWDFVESFYQHVPLFRSIDRHRGYQLFELHDRRIVVAAFDSISGADCFQCAGAIRSGVIGRCSLDLTDIPRSYHLRIAVWHHSIEGPPQRSDYMDVGQIREMIGLRFQLGMHGHQHSAAAATHYVHLGESQPMAVVSAGSLCASSRDLPRGINRQYNVIVIDEDRLKARVHVREMAEGEQFSRKGNGVFSRGFVELNWAPDTDAVGRPIDVCEENARRALLLAENSLHAGLPQDALDSLAEVELTPGSHARRIAVEAASRLHDGGSLIKTISEPHSTEETVLLVTALVESGSLDRAVAVLANDMGIDPGTRRELDGLIETRRAMRGQ